MLRNAVSIAGRSAVSVISRGSVASPRAFIAHQASSPFSTQVTPFLLADIGEGIAEVELMQWFVKEGQVIKSFDKICEVQSDKATVEITSRYDGVVSKVHHAVGSIVKVGHALVDITRAGSGGDEHANPAAPVASPKTVPAVDHTPVVAAVAAAPTSVHSADLSHNEKVKATPATRKIAKENNIDLRLVSATGPAGRVLKEDVQAFLRTGSSSSSGSSHSPSPVPAASESTYAAPAVLAEDVRVPIRGVKRLMVKSMQAAQQVQHLTLMEEVNMDSLVRVRSELKVVAEKRGMKLSYLPFVLKAASLALAQFPMLNSTVNADVTEVVHHANHNIGVAMDTPNGLVVPVLRAIQNKSIFEISQELAVLQEKAVTGKLTEKDFQGGTFSLSNIGSIAGTYATPVLVVPQVMIGAIGRMQVLPRYVGKNGKPATPTDVENGTTTAVAATVMNISWSADHRVVDGATVARFSNVWKGYIEQPNTMMGALR